jgi:hypothetical protein
MPSYPIGRPLGYDGRQFQRIACLSWNQVLYRSAAAFLVSRDITPLNGRGR